MRSEKGFSLIEVMVALAILSIIAVAFLGAMATSSKTLFTTDKHNTANNLAESQMEHIKSQMYALSYSPAPIPDEYTSYSAIIDVEPFQDNNIQKVTITIIHNGTTVTTLQDYKVNR